MRTSIPTIKQKRRHLVQTQDEKSGVVLQQQHVAVRGCVADMNDLLLAPEPVVGQRAAVFGRPVSVSPLLDIVDENLRPKTKMD